MNIIESKIVRTTRVQRIEIDRETVLRFLAELAGFRDIPDNAAIYVEVPGGCDWSNTQLDIDHETPVIVTWSRVTENDDA